MVPSIFGFDPRFQLIHEDDVVRSILFVLEHDLPGIYNVAGDGMLPWSEVATICGKRTVPLPPLATSAAAWPLRIVGYDIPPETLDLLRYGRGVDDRSLKSTPASGTATRRPAPWRTSSRPCACVRRSGPPIPSTATRPMSSSSSSTPPPSSGTQPTCMNDSVLVDIVDGVATVTLNDPDKRNAISFDMVDEISEAFDALEADEGVGAIVVTGAPPAFCAGADLSHLGASRRGRAASDLRGLPTPQPLPAADPRRGERRRRRGGPEHGPVLRRPPRRRRAPASTPGSCSSASIRAAATRGCCAASPASQATMAAGVFGDVLDGREAERVGLVWRCDPRR